MAKSKEKVVVVFILLLIMISLGVSYAYWSLVNTQIDDNLVSSACLSISFTGENDISLSGTYPMKDEKLIEFFKTTTPYHFTITNECDTETNVVINLETLGGENKLGDQYIDVVLYNGRKSFEEILTNNSQIYEVYSKRGESHSYDGIELYDYKLTNNLENDDKVLEEATKAYRLYEFTLKGKASRSFNLIEYMSQDTPALEETMNKAFTSKITVSTSYSPPPVQNMLAARGCTDSCENDTNTVFQQQYLDNTTKIVFENTMNPPTTYVSSYDESSLKDGSVMAYVIENEETPGTYTIKFQTNGIFLMESGAYYFYDFSKVTELEGLEYVDTSKVVSMAYMFSGMNNLTWLDVSSFDTSNVVIMDRMFFDMASLQTLDLSTFDTRSVRYMGGMFRNMTSLKVLDIQNFQTTNVTQMDWMFENCSLLTSLDVSSFDTSNVTTMSGMFRNMSSLTTLDIQNFETPNVTRMNGMFQNMTSLQSLDVSHFDTKNVVNMSYMFSYVSNISELDVSHFDTSKVTNMEGMFQNANNLTFLDLSNFDTSDVTSMKNMFEGMNNIISLDVSAFNTSTVTNMNGMFRNMSNLQSLDLSNFNTSNVTNMEGMFNNDINLQTILYGANFVYNNEASVLYMFANCPANKPTDASWDGVI